MPKRAALCAAIGLAALAVGVPTLASAATTRTVVRSAPVRVNTTVRTNTRVNVVRTPQVKTTVRTTTFRKLNVSGTGPGTGGHNPKFHKGTNPSNVHVTPATLKVTPNLSASPALKLGPGKINPALVKPVNFPVVTLANNKFAPLWKSQHKIWWGGKWKYFVPFTALGVVLVGGTYFYPDAYVGFARPYCVGLTPDGCQLNWQMVNFEDGGADWQCVQFCPRPNALPPPQAAALVAPPPVPQGTCELTIFSETNFAGTGVTTGDEQPQLSQSGWQNQIASIQVNSGTWDFFTDENFTGNTMRLQPGPYQDLGPEWNKRIGSFMCVQPGQ
jgi:hypothetical protein